MPLAGRLLAPARAASRSPAASRRAALRRRARAGPQLARGRVDVGPARPCRGSRAAALRHAASTASRDAAVRGRHTRALRSQRDGEGRLSAVKPLDPWTDLDRPPLREVAVAGPYPGPDAAWREVHVVASTGSTNADLARLGRRPASPSGYVLVADHQAAAARPAGPVVVRAAARGSRGRPCCCGPRSTPARWSWLPLLAGLGVVDALRRVVRRRRRARSGPTTCSCPRPSAAGGHATHRCARSAACSPRPSRAGRRARRGRGRARAQRRPGPPTSCRCPPRRRCGSPGRPPSTATPCCGPACARSPSGTAAGWTPLATRGPATSAPPTGRPA